MKYFLELSYDGTPYHGWQRQPNAISVQEVLEGSLSTILRSKIDVVGAGRTDAGVHARQIMAHFEYRDIVDPDQLQYKLNAILPAEIAIQNIRRVQENAH